MNNEYDEKLLETVAFSNGCICSMELIQWEHTHFHPSGDVIPSEQDWKFTRGIQEAGDLLGVELLDHIIVGENETYFSMSETHRWGFREKYVSKDKEAS